MSATFFHLLSAATALLVGLPAQTTSRAATTLEDKQPVRTITVTLNDDSTIHGRIEAWSASGDLSIHDDAGAVREVNCRDMDQVRFDGVEARPALGEWELQTTDEMQVRVSLVSGEGESVRLRSEMLGEFDQPFETLRSLTRPGALLSGGRDVSVDRVLMKNGDRLQGTIVSADLQGVTLIGGSGPHTTNAALEADEGGEIALAWEAMAAILVGSGDDTEGTSNSPHAGAPPSADVPPKRFRIRLADGGSIISKSIRMADGAVEAESLRASLVRIELSHVRAIETLGAGRCWLSNLTPARYESIAFFSRTWALGVDQNALGGPLTMGGVSFPRGLGLHSACRATYRLDGGFKRLTGLVGIDDSAGPPADANFIIRSGSVVLAREEALRAGAPARAVDVDVSDLTELTIEIEFGERGPVQDRVDFVNAALRR